MSESTSSNGDEAAPTPDTVGPDSWPETSTPSVLGSIESAFGPIPSVFLRADAEASTVDFLPGESGPSANSMLGRYKILGEIARGGMGAVLKGRDADLNRDLAIKVLLEKYAENVEVLGRFVEEAQIAGQLQHPGIVPVYDLGQFPDKRPFFAMKLVKGRTLSDLLKERPSATADLPRFLKIFEQICETLAYAHSKGVIHRDLKPLNVMVGAFGEVQVMDWGLAKILDRKDDPEPLQTQPQASVIRTKRNETGSSPTLFGDLMGTIAYMPPEQARGEIHRLDERTDVFALGSILCDILTGHPAYRGRTHQELIDRAKIADLTDARARLDACGAEPDLIAIATTCLAPIPEDRPRDAGQVARLISAYLSGVQERLRAAEIARVEQTARAEEAIKREAVERSRRRRTLALAATSLVALVVFAVGLVVVVGLNRRLEKANTKLDKANTDLASALKSTTEARNLAEERKKAADENFTLALDAVKAQVFDIERQLRNRPGTRDLREKLQKSATERLKSLIERTSRRGEVDHAAIWAHFNLGDVYLEIDGKPSLAREQYQEALDLATKLAKADPRDAQAQRDLSVSYNKLGDVLIQTGEAAKALESYQKALTVSETLAKADPRDAQAQRDLSVSYNKLGDVLIQTGEAAKALDSYQKALTVSETLAKADPRDAQAQRDLSVSYDRLGNVLIRTGEAAKALDSYQKALTVSETLAKADPRDAQAQRDLSVSYDRLGNVLIQTGEAAKALESYQKALTVSETLAKADPRDAQAQRDLSVSYNKLGDVLLQTGEAAKALDSYQKALTMRETLAKADPRDAQAQRDLSISYENLGNVLLQTGEAAKALDSYQKALTMRETLAKADPRDAQAQRDLSVSYNKLGDVLLQTGEATKALDSYQKALTVSETLAKADPRDARAQRDLRFSVLKHRLALIVAGEQKPKDNPERLELAKQAYFQKLHATSARLYAEALAADPKLGEDFQTRHLYFGASAAALAGSGQGFDVPKPDEAARTKLRAQALDWLKAEFAVWEVVAAIDKPEAKNLVAKKLKEWKQNADLVGIHDPEPLAKLPEDERKAWQALWADVDALLKKVQGP